MAESLRKKSIRGVIWSAVQRFGLMALSFIANMILARLLSPSDFGCIAMLSIFLVVADTFMNCGLGSALIQKKELTSSDSATVFYFNLAVSIILYLILFISAPWISDFYNIPILSIILRVEGIILIINSFGIVQTSLLKRTLEFKLLAKADITASIISVVAAVGSACLGIGVWALVVQQVVLALLRVVILWWLNSWRPKGFFSKGSFKQLISFGSFIFLSNLINNVANKIQAVIIGKAFNASILGYYSQAKNLEEVASQSISGVIDQVTYPALAAKQHDKPGMVSVIRQMTNAISFVTMPLMMMLSLIGYQVIVLCYGVNWVNSVYYFKVLCFAGIAISLQGVNYYAVAAIGKSKACFYGTIVKRIVSVGLLFLGLIWGMNGLLYAVVTSSYFILLVNAILVQYFLKYTILQQIKDLMPTILLTASAYCFARFLELFLDINIYMLGSIQVIVFCVFFIGIAYLLKFKSIEYVKEILKTIVKKGK